MTHLVRYEAARTALAEARRVDEVKDIRDKAQALAAYARQARDTDMIAWATEIKVRAERRCGEMLRETAASGARATVGNPQWSHDATNTLSDLGLTKSQSSRYQALAAMPDEHFEVAVATAKAQTGEVTTAHMLRVADEMKRTADVTRELTENARAARWRALRWRLEAAQEVLPDLRRSDTPPCDPEERGRILIAWRAIDSFLNEDTPCTTL